MTSRAVLAAVALLWSACPDDRADGQTDSATDPAMAETSVDATADAGPDEPEVVEDTADTVEDTADTVEDTADTVEDAADTVEDTADTVEDDDAVADGDVVEDIGAPDDGEIRVPELTGVIEVPDAPGGLEATIISTACEAPAQPGADGCVLDEDIVLDQTLFLDAGVALDCQGHTLSPDEDRAPQVAVMILNVGGASVLDCAIEDFAYGIAVAGADHATISGNDVVADEYALYLIDASHSTIRDNTLRARRFSSAAVTLTGDSDDNVIRDNAITVGPDDGAGPDFETRRTIAPTYPRANTLGAAIELGRDPYPGLPTIANIRIGGGVAQFIWDPEVRTEDNVIGPGNVITVRDLNRLDELGFYADAPVNVIILAGVTDTVIRGNTLIGGSVSVWSFRMSSAARYQEPGTCSDEPELRCERFGLFDEGVARVLSDAGLADPCFGLGACSGAGVTEATDHRALVSSALLIEDNHVMAPGVSGIDLSGVRGAIVRNNTLTGTYDEDTLEGMLYPIGIGNLAAEDIVVIGNTLVDTSYYGVFIAASSARSWGAEVSGNDFGPADVEAIVSRSTRFAAPMSGNHWGYESCPAFDHRGVEGSADFGAIRPRAGDCAPLTAPPGQAGAVCDWPPELKRVCGISAAATNVAARIPTGVGAVTVEPRIDGAFRALAHGPVLAVGDVPCINPEAYEREQNPGILADCTAPEQGDHQYHVLWVPAGTRHVRFEMRARTPHHAFVWVDVPGQRFAHVDQGEDVTLDLTCDPCESPMVVGVRVDWIDRGQVSHIAPDGGLSYETSVFWLGDQATGFTVTSGPTSVSAGSSERILFNWSDVGPGRYIGSLTYHDDAEATGYYGDSYLGHTIIELQVPEP